MWNARELKVSVILKGLGLAAVVSGAVFAGAHGVGAAPETRIGLPQDWSHHHLVMSSPRNLQTMVAIRQDPRLLHQMLKNGAFGLRRVNSQELEEFGAAGERGGHQAPHQDGSIDWSVTLGAPGSHVPRSMFPAKFTFDVNAPPDCVNDFVVFPTFALGSATQATIVAYNELYSTQGVAGGLCNQNGPSVKWAYNTGGGVRSSPVLSLNGTKVAFVARATGVVHVLTIGTTGANGTSVTAPATPGLGNNAVDTKITLNGRAGVTVSALFVDYRDDVGYVGDDAGTLHKVTGLFNGTLAEVTSGGWPVTVSVGGAQLNGPVFDLATNNIFVTDNAGNLSYVREVGSTSGACASGAPPCLGITVLAVSPGNAIVDAPIVDSSTGRVFTETSASGTNSQIVQTDTTLGGVVRVNVGGQDAAHPLHTGDFDNNYLNSVGTGFYYVCGKDNTAAVDPTLYRIGFNAAGVMNGAPDAATIRLARAAGECSPVTNFFNTGSTPQKNWLFVAVSTRCSATTGIAGGCVMSYDITAGMPAAFTARSAQRNGTSGIIIDNVSQVPQASNIYFSSEGNGPCGDGTLNSGCAVKLTQSGLQ